MKSEKEIARPPRDASAVILLDKNLRQVVWAQRNPQLAFLGGWHAFPGGKVEASDAEIRVKNCADRDLEQFVVAAARECFEEVGVLLARGGERLTKGQRASLHDDLISGRFSFAEILESWNLHLDAIDFFYAGFWTTPQFSPARFKTRFFIAVCPEKQTPYDAISELRAVEFVAPEKALDFWKNGQVLISPPVLIALKELFAVEVDRGSLTADERGFGQTNQKTIAENRKLKNFSQKLFEKSQTCDGAIDYIELNSRLICFPAKTETLPPATHTNCFIVGGKEFVVIDAAARGENEQAKLFKLIDDLIERSGGVCREIIVSHLHRDHIGAERALRKHLLEKFAMRVPVSAHRLTLEKLYDIEFEDFDKILEDGDVFTLSDENGKAFDLQILHTPGHARGHLAFYDEEFGFLLASDNVSGVGSVLIAAPGGNMIDYLKSLEKLKNLPNLKFLCGSHGAAIFDAKSKIESYIAHRLERERKIVEAIEDGAKNTGEIVEKVYADVSVDLRSLAEKSVEAHLEKLKTEGFQFLGKNFFDWQ